MKNEHQLMLILFPCQEKFYFTNRRNRDDMIDYPEKLCYNKLHIKIKKYLSKYMYN